MPCSTSCNMVRLGDELVRGLFGFGLQSSVLSSTRLPFEVGVDVDAVPSLCCGSPLYRRSGCQANHSVDTRRHMHPRGCANRIRNLPPPTRRGPWEGGGVNVQMHLLHSHLYAYNACMYVFMYVCMYVPCIYEYVCNCGFPCTDIHAERPTLTRSLLGICRHM